MSWLLVPERGDDSHNRWCGREGAQGMRFALGTSYVCVGPVGNRNILKFVEYLALFDPVMDKHLRKIRDAETHIHCLGKDIQNELIQLLSSAIKEEILTFAHAAKYCSIILDCTSEVGNVEQITMILKITVSSDPENCEPVSIKEHFLGFVPLKDTTGAGMTDTILHQLEEMSLPVENLCGQGYDFRSNMKRKENGVQ